MRNVRCERIGNEKKKKTRRIRGLYIHYKINILAFKLTISKAIDMTGQSKSLFSYGLFVHACSGSAASCVALTFAFPFLTLVQRRQRKYRKFIFCPKFD